MNIQVYKLRSHILLLTLFSDIRMREYESMMVFDLNMSNTEW